MNCYLFVLGTGFTLSSQTSKCLFKLNPGEQTGAMFGMSSRAEGNKERLLFENTGVSSCPEGSC